MVKKWAWSFPFSGGSEASHHPGRQDMRNVRKYRDGRSLLTHGTNGTLGSKVVATKDG